MKSERPHILIAQIGDTPAVVTEARDELAKEGFPIKRVVVAYTRPMKPYFTLLKVDFIHGEYKGRISLDGIELPLNDVKNEEECLTYRKLLLAIIEREMEKGEVHLLIAGGRKTMVVDATLVALATGLKNLYHVRLPKGAAVIRGEAIPKIYDLEGYIKNKPPQNIINQIGEICHPRIKEVLLIKIPIPTLDEYAKELIRSQIT